MCPVNTSLYAPRRRPADEGLKIPPTLPLVLMWYPSWLTVSIGFQNLFNNRAQLRHAVGPVVGLPGRDVVFGFDVTIPSGDGDGASSPAAVDVALRSEEHTSELQSRGHLVCRLLLEKKNSKALRCARDRHL